MIKFVYPVYANTAWHMFDADLCCCRVPWTLVEISVVMKENICTRRGREGEREGEREADSTGRDRPVSVI